MLFNDIDKFLNKSSEKSNFKINIEENGGHLIFSNSGKRGGRKFFTISLVAIKSMLQDIKSNFSKFELYTNYVEKDWRDLSTYYTDETIKAMATVQTKPLFITISKIINWANNNTDNHDENLISLTHETIDNTIEKLETLIQYFTPKSIEDKFRIYLKQSVSNRGNNFSEYRINEFIQNLKEKIPNAIEDDNSLLDITDINELNLIKDKLNDKNDFLNSFNIQEGNGRPSNAIFQYINFLKEVDLNITKEITEKSLLKFSNESKGNLTFPYKNILFKGVPGTGKSRAIDNIIEKELKIKGEKDNILRINIHSASSNADLMQGIGISTSAEGMVKYSEKQGLILDIIKRATFHPNQPFVLILEEIQENSLNELIGDLIYLIEEDKRAKTIIADNEEYSYKELVDKLIEEDNTISYIEIPYLVNDSTDYKKMIMPNNLFIFCTSNYRDDKKVIEDNLLRRFEVIEIYPNSEVAHEYVREFFTSLNESILEVMDDNHETHPDRFMIGHSIWKDVSDEKSFYKAFSKLITEFKDIREVEFDIFKEILKDIEFPKDIEVELKNSYFELIKDLQVKIDYGFID